MALQQKMSVACDYCLLFMWAEAGPRKIFVVVEVEESWKLTKVSFSFALKAFGPVYRVMSAVSEDIFMC